jgi:hypothetical protein
MSIQSHDRQISTTIETTPTIEHYCLEVFDIGFGGGEVQTSVLEWLLSFFIAHLCVCYLRYCMWWHLSGVVTFASKESLVSKRAIGVMFLAILLRYRVDPNAGLKQNR